VDRRADIRNKALKDLQEFEDNPRLLTGKEVEIDIQEEEFPPAVRADFPYPMSDGEGRLTRVLDVPLAEHLGRLERSRAILLKAFRGMLPDEWRRPRHPGDVDYEVTPEWAVFHLVEHEAGHAFQISSLKARVARFFASQPDGKMRLCRGPSPTPARLRDGLLKPLYATSRRSLMTPTSTIVAQQERFEDR